MVTWCKEVTHWKRPWCWEKLRAGGEGGDREWNGWMASSTQWTWFRANSGDSKGQGSLTWGYKELDRTEQLKNNNSRASLYKTRGFPGNSTGKESACNAGDPSSIPELGRCPGEGISYPFQYFWASLVAQLVKNQPAMQSLGWGDPLEEGMATHSSILRKYAWTEEPGVNGVTKSQTWLNN